MCKLPRHYYSPSPNYTFRLAINVAFSSFPLYTTCTHTVFFCLFFPFPSSDLLAALFSNGSRPCAISFGQKLLGSIATGYQHELNPEYANESCAPDRARAARVDRGYLEMKRLDQVDTGRQRAVETACHSRRYEVRTLAEKKFCYQHGQTARACVHVFVPLGVLRDSLYRVLLGDFLTDGLYVSDSNQKKKVRERNGCTRNRAMQLAWALTEGANRVN